MHSNSSVAPAQVGEITTKKNLRSAVISLEPSYKNSRKFIDSTDFWSLLQDLHSMNPLGWNFDDEAGRSLTALDC